MATLHADARLHAAQVVQLALRVLLEGLLDLLDEGGHLEAPKFGQARVDRAEETEVAEVGAGRLRQLLGFNLGRRTESTGRAARWKPARPQLRRAPASPPGRSKVSFPPVFMPERSWCCAPQQPHSRDSSGRAELEASLDHPYHSACRSPAARSEHGKYDFPERLGN